VLDFRYHVTSLVAVFFALIIGIVVGVGISGRGFVDKSERHKLESRIDRLQSRVDELSAQNDDLREQQRAGGAFMSDAYPVLMERRLAGKRIAVVVVGGNGGATSSDVNQTLEDADATTARYRAIKLPVAAPAVRRALAGVPGYRLLPDAGRELAQEWVTGGKTPVADALTSVVVEEQRGSGAPPVDGVVVIPAGQARDGATRRFLEGLYAGLGTGGVPVVVVEQSNTDVSVVPQFRGRSGFSTVDDVDTPSGRFALALLLGGAPRGDFGLKPTATAPLPKIVPTPAGA
jgi:Copper transport outer membrane protein, MctB